jgi:Ca-activated chloride channel family protein
MSFHDPAALLLLLPLTFIFIIRLRRSNTEQIRFPGMDLVERLPITPRQRIVSALPIARGAAIILMVLALARPQLLVREVSVTSRGIDLVLALDISTSMLAMDRSAGNGSKPRLQMAKDVMREFIAKRDGDRIAVVAFAARPYPIAPLTLDHQWLNSSIEQLNTGAIEDGTAVGDALLTAVNRLHTSPAKSRSVLLVTDGRNNAGAVSPAVAAQAAKALGIKVHTIGIGANGVAVFPVEDPLGGITYREVKADLDVATLSDISRTTEGRFFLATDADSLGSVFREIDRLEKRPIEEKVSNSAREMLTPLLLTAIVIMLAETILRATWLRRVP